MSEYLNPTEIRLLIYLLTRLEKRIYILRVSLYGDTENYFPDDILLTKKRLQMKSDDFAITYNLSVDDYRLMVDSCEIEACIRRILYGLENTKSYEPLKEVVMELENESTAFKKHQKMLDAKRKQIEQLEDVLSILREQAQTTVKRLKSRKLAAENAEDKFDSINEVEFLKELVNYKIESRKKYYEHKADELKESIEWFEREGRTQAHADAQTISFWMLKYDAYSEKLDVMLKEMFDNWSLKRRELRILKKYRKLNLEKIEKLQKLIAERTLYIENYLRLKEIERKRREEELKRIYAATTIQAYWRGTMVRKHLGPYKKKKGKGKKGKGKKGKGKKGKGAKGKGEKGKGKKDKGEKGKGAKPKGAKGKGAKGKGKKKK